MPRASGSQRSIPPFTARIARRLGTGGANQCRQDFLFSVKMPKMITHGLRLEQTDELTSAFLEEISVLGATLGFLLVQTPPTLAFHAAGAEAFFDGLRARSTIPILCEPRHASWFTDEADELLVRYEIARVAADPARVPAAAVPGGWRGLSYYRLHGSPQIYRSSYDAAFIDSLGMRVAADLAASRTVCAIFDNTTLGAATRNAFELTRALADRVSI